MSEEKQATKPARTKTKPEQATTITFDHPKLGSALGVLDDRGRSRQRLVLSFVWMATGLLGIVMGSGDLSHGDGLGWFWFGGGVVLIGYGLMELWTSAVRLRRPVRLAIADDGLDVADGPGPIPWRELKEVRLIVVGRQNEAVGLRVLVADPTAFLAKHHLGWNDARKVRSSGWLEIKGLTAMPLEKVADILRERIPGAQKPLPQVAPAALGSGATRARAAASARAAGATPRAGATAGAPDAAADSAAADTAPGPRPKRRTSRH